MNIEKCLVEIDEAWKTNLYEGPEYLEKMKDHSWYKNESVDTWKSYAKTILESFPNWDHDAWPQRALRVGPWATLGKWALLTASVAVLVARHALFRSVHVGIRREDRLGGEEGARRRRLGEWGWLVRQAAHSGRR